MNETSFENKCAILSELWIRDRNAEGYKEFVEFNDLGLPLAYAIHNGLVVKTSRSDELVSETFAMFLDILGVEDDGWHDYQQILDSEFSEEP